jgi:phosphoribosylformylglycinamidine synthase
MNRIFVEKKPQFTAEARHLLHDLRESLGLPALTSVRVVQRYDVDGLSAAEFAAASQLILSEPQIDATATTLELAPDESAFAVEYLPGQFDQRADSAAQCVQILTGKDRPLVAAAKVIILGGTLSPDEVARVKAYVINAVDSHEVPVAAPGTRRCATTPPAVAILTGFTRHAPAALPSIGIWL